ncbi:hypothetical protein ACFFLS_05740 [Flavobacterium procerum]|uniref:Transposase n=1 Tax=Flavobacterium procerum TaxID=1455569 RepID=A0ABV6BPJ5_9FLAO
MNSKGHFYPKAIILQAVYFKRRLTLSYRNVEKKSDALAGTSMFKSIYKLAP